MFCPECKTEYRPGFNRCSDCGVSLVEQLPKTPDRERENFRTVYTTNYQDDCVSVCKQFSAAAIPFKVFQQTHQVLREIEQTFAIGVPAEFCHQAEGLIRESRLDFTDEPDEDDGASSA
jgi:hypothetical protein